MSEADFTTRPVTDLPGISSKRNALFDKIGVRTWGDLLCYYPREYEDWSNPVSISELTDGGTSCFDAWVATEPAVRYRGRRSQVRLTLSDDTGAVRAVWFNQPWQAKKLRRGMSGRWRGTIKRQGRYFSVANPDFVPAGEPWPPLSPIYPLTEGLTQAVIRKAMTALLSEDLSRIFDALPPRLAEREHFVRKADALRRIHYPECPADAEAARRRLALEEFFVVIAGLRLLKAERGRTRGLSLRPDAAASAAFARLIDSLPYQLTVSQQAALEACLDDLTRDYPACRLIQGDVGSGKTAVAMLLMAATALAGAQSVFMAPTAILARQHADKIAPFLGQAGIRTACLMGQTSAGERREIVRDLSTGRIHCLIGTHAVLEEDVVFQKLGLCITDEQHRFGVAQRLRLGSKAETEPHVIVMSATPIPRTLGLVLYGDLDISDMRVKPAGRRPVATYTARDRDRHRVNALIEREIEKGRLTYVVCPSIGESELPELMSAETMYTYMTRVFPSRRVSLLHGRMKADEKEAVMKKLNEGAVDILVSTTVIEVGVDCPRATLLIIENAERFGLAQLHQLRGRVGRSCDESYCILMSDTDDEQARERLNTLCRFSDGFKIAEEDLRLRGPGDFGGYRQSGLPLFRAASLPRDTELMTVAAQAVDALIDDESEWDETTRQAIMRSYRTFFADGTGRPGI